MKPTPGAVTDPMLELPVRVHNYLFNLGLETKEQVIKAFDNGEIRVGRGRHFGKKSYAAVAAWIGRPTSAIPKNAACYIEGMERVLHLFELGAFTADVEREIEEAKRSLKQKIEAAKPVKQPAKPVVYGSSLWWRKT